MTGTFDVAVVGALSPAGEALIERLAEAGLPLHRLYPLEAGEPEAVTIPFRERNLPLQSVDGFDFSGMSLAIFAGDPAVAASHAERAAEEGAVVLDATGLWSADASVPLLTGQPGPSLMAEFLAGRRGALPGPLALHAAMLAAPFLEAGITRIDITALRAVTAAGRPGAEALASETIRLLNTRPLGEGSVFGRQIAFNILPQTGPVGDDRLSSDERLTAESLKRMLALPTTSVSVTALFVPVFYGDSLLLRLQTRQALDADEAERLLDGAPGIELVEGPPPTPVTDAAQGESVYVGRLRAEPAEGWLQVWSVADAARAALAATGVQIAESLVKDYSPYQ